MHVASSAVQITESMIDRLPGSRGHLTLAVDLAATEVNWWVFDVSGETSAHEFAADMMTARCLGIELTIPPGRARSVSRTT